MRKGFTLIELLVVIGILAILLAVLMVSFKNAPMKAEIAKCHELVKNTETALVQTFDTLGCWPEALIKNNNMAKGLDAKAAYPLAKKMGLSYDENMKTLKGLNKFGIVTTWAEQVIKDRGESCTESDPVPSVGGTIADHRLRYALSLDGKGVIKNVNVASTIEGLKDAQTYDIRTLAAVWCRGPRGEFIQSWSDGQTEGVK